MSEQKKTEADTYAKAGTEHAAAFEKMLERPEKLPPPSYEVFAQQLKDEKTTFKRVSPTELADRLIKNPASSLMEAS